MANKDLMKRAFSVTANLPPASQPHEKAAIATAPVDIPMALPETGVHVVPVASAEPALRPTPTAVAPVAPVAPKTGPGTMLAFMTDQSEIHKEVVKLRAIAADFEQAEPARRMDPKQIKPSKWANRDDTHFQTVAFARLKEEIGNAGGNVQPIKVRPVAGEPVDGVKWEIVFGHRRHRACLELGISVFTLIQHEMADAELFVEMERENREREDLSAWEQGVMYMRALEQGLFPSAKQLAAAIDRDMSNISRAMALAKLPSDVVRAFGSPLNLQFRWATELKDANQRDPEGLLAMSRELASRPSQLSPGEVFALLTGASKRSTKGQGAISEWKDNEGKRLAVLTLDRNRKVSIAFDQPMDETQQRRLGKLIDGFFGRKG